MLHLTSCETGASSVIGPEKFSGPITERSREESKVFPDNLQRSIENCSKREFYSEIRDEKFLTDEKAAA